MEEAAKAIEKLGGDLNEDLGEIRKQVEGISSVWDGEAKTAYQETMRKWDHQTSEVHQALQQIAKVIRLGKDGYQATDLKAAKWFHPAG
ncbi:WXG100 family type VII secretion target [Streptomyces tubbatahanensis]|uniref:WXG100 family type VII secretion target n=1 Tax=Streptomyces tubbatahanensis TaxID=2923272 RepID=A0ABY3XY14_9ACTN|nr:WXG100 family type VII secretion target [Streptomyces tubbatahanensis]